MINDLISLILLINKQNGWNPIEGINGAVHSILVSVTDFSKLSFSLKFNHINLVLKNKRKIRSNWHSGWIINGILYFNDFMQGIIT